MEGEGDHRLSATGRRVEDNVLAIQKFQDCFFLGGVKRRSASFCPHHKLFQDVFGRNVRAPTLDSIYQFIDIILEVRLVLLCHNGPKITLLKMNRNKFTIFK